MLLLFTSKTIWLAKPFGKIQDSSFFRNWLFDLVEQIYTPILSTFFWSQDPYILFLGDLKHSVKICYIMLEMSYKVYRMNFYGNFEIVKCQNGKLLKLKIVSCQNWKLPILKIAKIENCQVVKLVSCKKLWTCDLGAKSLCSCF